MEFSILRPQDPVTFVQIARRGSWPKKNASDKRQSAQHFLLGTFFVYGFRRQSRTAVFRVR